MRRGSQVGLSQRENSYFYIQDGLASQTSFLDGAVGIFPGGNSEGEVSTSEIYGELLLPLASDFGIFDEFSLELGYRYSDNDPTEAVETYKAMFDWRVNDHLRLRGGRNVANRAPNIGELFEAKTQIVGAGGSTLGDLCYASNTTGGAISANPALNPNAAQVRAMCEAQMGVDRRGRVLRSGKHPGRQHVGQPHRQPEPALGGRRDDDDRRGAQRRRDRTQISIDAYEITITDYIAAQLGESVFRTCYDPAFNPTYSPFTAACNQILRDPTNGQIGAVDVTYSNSSSVETSGVDVQFDWGTDLAGGNLRLNFLTSYLDSMKTKLSADRGVERVEGHVGAGGPVGLEFGRVRLPDVHDAELREERLEPRPALAAPADDQAVGVRVESEHDDHRHAVVRRVRPVGRARCRGQLAAALRHRQPARRGAGVHECDALHARHDDSRRLLRRARPARVRRNVGELLVRTSYGPRERQEKPLSRPR